MRNMIAGFLLLFTVPVHAAPNAIVQGVQMPAWLQRGATTQPLAVGMELNDGDKLTTGAHARILLQTADGSAIKLGENASLAVSNLAQQRDGQGLFSALLDVAKGAFRFTTAIAAKLRSRDVTVKIAGATIGIRGTDIWGKAGGQMSIAAMEKAMGKSMADTDKEAKMDFDVVCLIEGKINVAHGSEAPFEMDQPQSFYVMRKDAPPLPVTGLATEQLAKWSAETEIAEGQGATRSGGKWKVDLLTADNEHDALAAYDIWREAGYAVRLQPVAKTDGWAYQLRIDQLASQAEAAELAKQLTGKFGATAPGISR